VFSYLVCRIVAFARAVPLLTLVISLIAVAALPRSAEAANRSIKEWASCNGLADDDTAAVQKAFEAARNNAFTLVVDCPLKLHSGMDAARGIFIDQNTTVQFSGSGKFTIDNIFHPAFVIADTSNVKLVNWNVEWDGSIPVNPDVGGYYLDGKYTAVKGQGQPAGIFNDVVLTPWLTANRAVKFDNSRGYVKAIWKGAVNLSAVFYITGDSQNITVTGLNLYVPANAGGSKYMPMAFSFSENYKRGQTVSGQTPITSKYVAVPRAFLFSGVTLDGTLMGFQGNLRDAMFENIVSKRYGDLQDSSGKSVGGIGKWFPPPHLFYLNYDTTDAGLMNNNLHLDNIQDLGVRSGVARDKGGSDTQSGFANSLKLGCIDCTVDKYKSLRPDGFMDVLPSDNLVVSNVDASFDSDFIHSVYPAGIRFASTGYVDLRFEDIQLTDTAATSIGSPIGHSPTATNVGMVFSNVQVQFHHWSGSGFPVPVIGGKTNNIALDFEMTSQATQVTYQLQGAVSTTLQTSPMTVRPGGTTILTWASVGASSCAATGAWNGAMPMRGTRAVKVGTSDNFYLNCKNGAQFAKTVLQVATE
jgi:hypothetical protein